MTTEELADKILLDMANTKGNVREVLTEALAKLKKEKDD